MSDENNNMGERNESGGFSFESILAEVKGSAFINGDKRTPPDLLQEKADRILREAAETTVETHPPPQFPPQQSPLSQEFPAFTDQQTPEFDMRPTTAHQQVPEFDMQSPTAEQQIPGFDMQPPTEKQPTPEFVAAQYMSTAQKTPQEQVDPFQTAGSQDGINLGIDPDFSETDEIPMIVTPLENESPQAGSQPSFMPIGQTERNEDGEKTVLFFNQADTNASQIQNQDTIVHNIDGQSSDESAGSEGSSSKWSFGNKSKTELFDFDTESGGIIGQETGYSYDEEDDYDEPSLRKAVSIYTGACNSISLRVMPASVITVLMIAITYVYEAGMVVPFGIGYSLNHAAGTLMLLLLFVMMLCADVIVRGVDFLMRGVPNAESLILFSCVFSLISAAFTILSGAAPMLPFCAVSAMSLTFAAHGEKYNLKAMAETLKTAVGSSEPYGVQAEYNAEIDKSVLKKAFNRTDGFYNNLMQPDITEIIYRYAAPALLISTLLLTILIVIVRGGVEHSLHILSALLAAAAPFSALLAFSVPFATVVKAAKKTGAAIAGWGGADDICFSDGVCVTDDDLFPPGMLRLSGVKVYDGASPENAMRYTASLIISSGSGLTSLFSEVLKQQGLSPFRTDGFECQESGISALIRGEQVSTGSAAYMNLLGVRVPDDSNMKNAVYTAVNNRLVAMFAIDYKPLPSVQSALISMLKWRIDLYFAMRDFNVTPAMVGQKFKVPFDSFVFIPAKDSYSISDLHSGKEGRMAAVLVREGLSPFAEAITGGRLLKSAAFFATILSVVSAALGVLIMFYMCWTGSFLSASPGNLVVFMLCMLTTVLIVCGYVRLKK